MTVNTKLARLKTVDDLHHPDAAQVVSRLDDLRAAL
jgi:hypothetical protein